MSPRPKIYYGWVMLPVATVMLAGTAPGQTFGVTAFNTPIREGLRISHTAIAGAYLVASLLAALPLPLIGRATDRFGLRLTGLVVSVMLGLACLVASRATGLITLAIGFFLLRTLGQGALTLIATNTLAMWFTRRLGLASGLSGVGVSAAVAILPASYIWLIAEVGWRNAYVWIAVATWATLVPLMMFLYRNRPEEVGQRIEGRSQSDGPDAKPGDDGPTMTLAEAKRTRSFWIGLIIIGLWGMIGTAIGFNLIPFFTSRGLSEAQAAGTFVTFAIFSAGSQLGGGYLADRQPLNRLLALGAGLFLVAVVALWATDSLLTAHIHAGFSGIAVGLIMSVNNTLWPRYFGRLHLGQIRGMVWGVTVAACSVGPLIMGGSMDLFGDYGPSLALFTVLVAVAAVAGIFATKPEPTGEG